jgi:hypothetical protein
MSASLLLPFSIFLPLSVILHKAGTHSAPMGIMQPLLSGQVHNLVIRTSWYASIAYKSTVEHLCIEQDVAVFLFFCQDLCLGSRPHGAADYTVSTWSRSHKTTNRVQGVPHIAGKQELFEKLPVLDIVVCLLPLTPETVGLINSGFLSRMKQGSVLINAGRGEHVVERDLLDALTSGVAHGGTNAFISIDICGS